MKKRIFISGSMSFQTLPILVIKTLEKIIKSTEYSLLIGDAKGVDMLIQKKCTETNFFDCTIFSVQEIPRNFTSDQFMFEHVFSDEKNPRKKQEEKDKVMTEKAGKLFVVWDGESKGSYHNILRGLRLKKHVEVFLKNRFLSQSEITVSNIKNIFENNSYFSASEILKSNVISSLKTVSQFQINLVQKNILHTQGKEYFPNPQFENLIKISIIRGKRILKYKKNILEKAGLVSYGDNNTSQKTELF